MNASHNVEDHGHRAVSRVDVPCLLYGSVGVCLAMAIHAIGLFKASDERLLGLLLGPLFHGEVPQTLPMPVQLLGLIVFCYGLAFAVLDSPASWRRVLIGFTVLVLVLAMVPSLAVWNIYFSPFLLLVGVFWTWFCTMMYVSHHLMPCEVTAAPASILAVSSAYKQPVSVDSVAHPKAVEAVEQVDTLKLVEKPKEAVDDSLEKYRPKKDGSEQGKEKVCG